MRTWTGFPGHGNPVPHARAMPGLSAPPFRTNPSRGLTTNQFRPDSAVRCGTNRRCANRQVNEILGS